MRTLINTGRPSHIIGFALLATTLFVTGCTQESQNKLGRAMQNWTGTNGVLEVFAGDKVIKRFLEIDKLSTAVGTNDSTPRPYRFGYGILDANLNGIKDAGESKVYFEFSDYSTPYVFFEQPK
ncbi:MAG: hypothetical protein V7707_04575 [Motiliproteus sp.]